MFKKKQALILREIHYLCQISKGVYMAQTTESET